MTSAISSNFFAVVMRKRRSNSNSPRGSRATRGREHLVSGELILYTTEDGQSHIQLRPSVRSR